MIGQNIQEKELYILGTMLNCNREIKKFKSEVQPKGIKLLESIDIQNAKTLNLFVHCSEITYQKLNEDFDAIISQYNITTNPLDNYYAYFKRVNNFLLESRNTDTDGIFTSLNESIPDEQHGVLNFQEELNSLIQKMETSREFNTINNITPAVLKIKSWAKSPIYACGFNLISNPKLMSALEKTGVTLNNLISICYNRYHKQLVFFTFDLAKTLVYSIPEDTIGLWNKINIEYQLPSIKLTPNNYKTVFRTESEINDFVELYFNINVLNPKFTDNLYRDNTYIEYLKKFEAQKQFNSLIK